MAEGIGLRGHAQMMDVDLANADPEVFAALESEVARQENKLQLIASENFASRAVLAAMGSVFTNKYAEGYPGKRYYGGCEFSDTVESLAIARALELFGDGSTALHANVQPHSGTQANMAVYFAALNPGDTLMGMDLAHGGHLTHGHPLSYSGKYFRVVGYGVRRDDERIDYDAMAELARRERPQIIVCGASAYSRTLDFARIRAVCDEVGALMMADIAHIAGLVATGLHPSPIPYADFVTSTTHKTLRGPRGGLILCKKEWGARLDKALFPGLQGGPLVHVVAAKAVAFREALSPGFEAYQSQVLLNARALAEELTRQGVRIVSGGTDNHLMLADLGPIGMTGKDAEALLEDCGITVNKNAIPFDPNPPRVASGIRVGTPAATTRGFGEAEMRRVGAAIGAVLKGRGDAAVLDRARQEVAALCREFPLYSSPHWPA